MIASNSSSICEQARPYYYEYLCRENEKRIPAEVFAHINKCRFCQAKINQLKIILAEAEEHAAESTGQTNSVITANLRLHFACVDAPVSCNTARPFLPSLADPALEVGVPTPITVHLDKCQQCTNALQTIRQLNLSHKQLCRLGQLFAEKPTEDAISCSQGQAAILAVVTMVFRETSAEVLKHLCTCPDCREVLYEYRETVHEELLHSQGDRQKFPCEEVSTSDIFDYCFPYGIDPASDQYAKFRPAFTSHACACPTCLGKMQQLHRTIYTILERQESGIVTYFKVDCARDSVVRGREYLYEDWPIEVQTFDKSAGIGAVEAEAPRTVERTAVSVKSKQVLSAPSVRLLTKVAAAAAVVILAAILLLNVPIAKAVDLEQIYKALQRINNVCLTTFVPEKSEPIQEVWISRALGIKMFTTETGRVLWGIKNKSEKSIDLNTGLIKTAKLDDNELRKVEETMDVPWGLLPFNNMSAVPKDAEWIQVSDQNIETVIPETEVYDLMWTEKRLSGPAIHRKWRGYINIETRLPKRIEWWWKHAEQKGYELRTIIRVAYPADAEIQAVIKETGF